VDAWSKRHDQPVRGQRLLDITCDRVYPDGDAVRLNPELSGGTIVRRTVELVIGVVAVVVLLAGCSSTAQPGQPGSTTAAPSPTPPSSADPNAGLKNGTQLKAVLLTTKDLPAGFKVSPAVVRDSGDVFGPRSTATTPRSSACRKLDTNVWAEGAGIGPPASFAQTGFTDSYGDEVDAVIDSFRGTDAQKVMANLRKLFAVCAKFKTTTSGTPTTVKVVAKAGPRVGDDSVKAVLTSPVWQGGTTLAAVRVGKAVVSVLYSSGKSDLGAAATNLAATIARRL